MSERLKLAEHFISAHGQAAARALEELPPEIAGSLIDAISDPLSLTSLKAMLPFHAAKCLAALPPETGAKYLSSLTPKEAATILRHLNESASQSLIDLLPKRHALRVSLILGYPQSLVGAWMDPLTLSIPVVNTVEEARTRLGNEGYTHSILFVVDGENRLRGSVSLVEILLQADASAPLSALIKKEIPALQASTSLERALDDKGWSNADILPVVDRSMQFIGVLQYSVLRRATTGTHGMEHASVGGDDLLGVTEACYLGLADLMAASLSADRDGAASR